MYETSYYLPSDRGSTATTNIWMSQFSATGTDSWLGSSSQPERSTPANPVSRTTYTLQYDGYTWNLGSPPPPPLAERLTAEARAAQEAIEAERRRRLEEEEIRRRRSDKEAERRAEELLEEWLDEEQRACRKYNGYFEVRGSISHDLYQLFPRISRGVYCPSKDKWYCLVSVKVIPLADQLAMQALLLQTDEPMFLAQARS